jgi:hypothetical protein
MSLVEFLRARRSFYIFGSILTAIVLSISISLGAAMRQHAQDTAGPAHVTITISGAPGSSHSTPAHHHWHPESFRDLNFKIPLGLLFGIAAYATIILATILGTSLNSENGRGGFAFTKPISRERLALTYFAVDAAAGVAIFALALILCAIALAAFGVLDRVFLDSGAIAVAAAGTGAALMWYGLLQALTSWNRLKGGLITGITWATFLIVLPLYEVTQLGPIFHTMLAGINYLNPLAYYTACSLDGQTVAVLSQLGFGTGQVIAFTWTLGIAGLAIATYGWKQVEV